MFDQNQPELDAANAECGPATPPAPKVDPVVQALQGVADAANAGKGEPFTTAARQLVELGHLTLRRGWHVLVRR